eukprot:651556-Rhodomonas_salina.1
MPLCTIQYCPILRSYALSGTDLRYAATEGDASSAYKNSGRVRWCRRYEPTIWSYEFAARCPVLTSAKLRMVLRNKYQMSDAGIGSTAYGLTLALRYGRY